MNTKIYLVSASSGSYDELREINFKCFKSKDKAEELKKYIEKNLEDFLNISKISESYYIKLSFLSKDILEFIKKYDFFFYSLKEEYYVLNRDYSVFIEEIEFEE